MNTQPGKGRIITVLGSKRGCGQSTVAANIAACLARKLTGQEAPVIIDLNRNGSNDAETLLSAQSAPGDPQSAQSADSEGTVCGLLTAVDHLDAGLLAGYMKSSPRGVRYLKRSSSRENDALLPEKLLKLLTLLRETSPFIIIDADGSFPEDGNRSPMLPVLDSSNLVLLVMTPDAVCFNRARRALEAFTSLHYPLTLVKLLLNMKVTNGGLTKENIAKFLGHEVAFEIPLDTEAVTSSVNQGLLPVLSSPRSGFSTAVAGICSAFTGKEELFAERTAHGKTPRVAGDDTGRAPDGGSGAPGGAAETGETAELKNTLHKKLLVDLDMKSIPACATQEKKMELRETTKQALERLLAREETQASLTRDQRTRLINEMLDEVLGLGPLELFLRDPSITEIMVSGKDSIYIEQAGKLKITGARFESDGQLYAVIERIVSPIGRRVDESSPICDARLADGSRVNIVIPPLALDGPSITIRKFSEKKLSPADLVGFGSVSREMVEFLKICVLLRKNIVISGGTGSGKTTLLNVLSSFIPEDERIVTIEDSAELKLQQSHVVRLESRPANVEGEGEIPIRKLVINALRMRPDRIVVGECRGGEALDMLQAMNTGHSGSLTTVHANTPRDALSRIETMFLMAGIEFPVRAIREQIRSAVNVIVQQSRISDGTRKITSVTEVTGMEGDVITLQDIFRFSQGSFRPTGAVPTFMEEVRSKGMPLDIGIFSK